jgi:hypothetical protein
MLKLAYCDKIADSIRKALIQSDPTGIIGPVGPIQSDLHPTQGYFISPKKVMTVHDMNGKAYVVTVEEAPMLDVDVETKLEESA